jgi:hypothetical protein
MGFDRKGGWQDRLRADAEDTIQVVTPTRKTQLATAPPAWL